MDTSGSITEQALAVTANDADAALAQLDSRHRDWLTPIAKGVLGACPVIGPMLAEVVGMAIPNQRVERIETFARILEARVGTTKASLERLHRSIATHEGIDLLEEGMTQATRAISPERQERIAQLVANALTGEELRYQESKKLLGLLRELTDPEILWLIYYSEPETFGSEVHQQLRQTHPEIFAPAHRSLGASAEELDRAALQDSYKRTLVQLGLLQEDNKQLWASHLGKMLVRALDTSRSNQD